MAESASAATRHARHMELSAADTAGFGLDSELPWVGSEDVTLQQDHRLALS